MANSVTWSGIIGVEGRPTGDGRYIVDGALNWQDLPLPLRYSREDVGGHDGAVVVGQIDGIERADSGMLQAVGRFDMGSEEGREAYRQVSEDLTTGVSMDLDDVSFEIRISSDVADLVESEQGIEDGEPAGLTRNEDGTATVMHMGPDDEVQWVTEGRVRAATIVAIPAFTEARLTAEEGQVADPAVEPVSVAASARPAPADWFTNPHFTGPTPLTVEDDGRVYGHLALWGTCHVGLPSCQTPPASATGYAGFALGSIRTDSGDDIPIGNITMGTGHAGPKLNAAQALMHYDNTGTQVARVAAGEDDWGIWLAGRLRPGVTDEQIETLRASPLSGDWRRQGTGLELIAMLAVNVPGFQVPRPAARVASGFMTSLVAAGMLPAGQGNIPGLTVADISVLRQAASRERGVQAAQMARRARVARVAVALDHAAHINRRVKAGV